MRRTLWVTLIAVVLLAMTATAAYAITYGTPDTAHPYVGLVGFYDEGGNWMWRCSGTLISDSVFLTAGHCTGADYPDNPDWKPVTAMVWFGDKIEIDQLAIDYPDLECYEDPPPPDTRTWTTYPCVGGVPGVPVANPEYVGLYLPNTHDAGKVLLTAPLPAEVGLLRGVLPSVGLLDRLATKRGLQNTTFTSVGYGLNSVKPTQLSLRERWYSVSHLVSLKSALTDGYNIQTSNNPGKWPDDPDAFSGGTCFGDSGGPLFYTYNGVEYLVGITSFGLNSNCKGTDFAYRTDTYSAQEFILRYRP